MFFTSLCIELNHNCFVRRATEMVDLPTPAAATHGNFQNAVNAFP